MFESRCCSFRIRSRNRHRGLRDKAPARSRSSHPAGISQTSIDGSRICWLALKLMLLVLVTATSGDSQPCQAVVWASDGGKWSVGGIGMVFCTCDSSDVDVADLHLLRRGKILDTDIINSTTVQYTEPKATETVQTEYECWENKRPLESVMVTVFAVLNVTDLTCRFHGDEQINCTFSRAEGKDFFNTTSYNLSVSTGTTGSTLCTPDLDNPARMQCGLRTVAYAKQMPNQNFTLTMTNWDWGGKTQTQEVVLPTVQVHVPEWPSDEMTQTLNNSLVCLSWTNEQELVNRNLVWLVELRPRRLGIPAQNLTLPGREKTDERTLTFCFPAPPQANQIFDVRLKLRFNATGAIWSEYYPEFNFTTKCTVPARPPQFLPDGFFYEEDNHELTVFWFQLGELEHNGPNLTYSALWDGSREANRYSSNSATFKNWDATKPATVSVRSRNIKGFSVNSSYLRVPAMSNVKMRQSTILEYHPASFKLTWEKPNDINLLRGYNVYWCNASDIFGQFCKDGAHIHHISVDDGDLPEYTFKSPMVLMDMAVSANYSDNASGGMNLRLVGDKSYMMQQSFAVKLARILEGICALLVLGLVVMSVKKLRNMANIKVELPIMAPARQPKATVEPEPIIGINHASVSHYYRNTNTNEVSIELTTFESNGGGTDFEAEVEENLDAEPAQESGSYVRMHNGNPIDNDGYICPTSQRSNITSNDNVEPPPPLRPSCDGYVVLPPPLLRPRSDGYVDSPPPQLRPSCDGYVDPPAPLLRPSCDGIDSLPPRLIPNNDGYINPPPPR